MGLFSVTPESAKVTKRRFESGVKTFCSGSPIMFGSCFIPAPSFQSSSASGPSGRPAPPAHPQLPLIKAPPMQEPLGALRCSQSKDVSGLVWTWILVFQCPKRRNRASVLDRLRKNGPVQMLMFAEVMAFVRGDKMGSSLSRDPGQSPLSQSSHSSQPLSSSSYSLNPSARGYNEWNCFAPPETASAQQNTLSKRSQRVKREVKLDRV